MNERTNKIKRILTEALEEHEKIWSDITNRGKRSWSEIKLREQDIIVLSNTLDRHFNELI